MCLKTGSCSHKHESAVGKTASGASRLLAVVTTGVGVLPMASGSMSTHSGSVLSSMFAQKGRQCYNIQSSVTGYLSWEKRLVLISFFSRGEHIWRRVVFYCCRATVQRGKPQLLFNTEVHPTRRVRPVTRPCFFTSQLLFCL